MGCDSILLRYSIFLSLVCVGRISSLLKSNFGSNGVCNTEYKKSTIYLKSGEDSALLLTDNGLFKYYTGRYPFNCNFVVKAKDRDDGIYVVVQDLNFREDSDLNCIDYVKMSVPMSVSVTDFRKFWKKDGPDEKRFCGIRGPGTWLSDTSIEEELNLEDKDLAPNAFIAPGGEVAVSIVIAPERPVAPKTLVVSLVFTSYKKGCFENQRKGNLMNCRVGECIEGSFQDDGIQNCPYVTCFDERGCRKIRTKTDDAPKDLTGSGMGTKVTFGAVGAILLVLLKFGLCLWFCKRMRRRRARQLPPARHVAIPCALPDVESPQPSAPPLQEIETKDLPPSYESLYPNAPPSAETRT